MLWVPVVWIIIQNFGRYVWGILDISFMSLLRITLMKTYVLICYYHKLPVIIRFSVGIGWLPLFHKISCSYFLVSCRMLLNLAIKLRLNNWNFKIIFLVNFFKHFTSFINFFFFFFFFFFRFDTYSVSEITLT